MTELGRCERKKRRAIFKTACKKKRDPRASWRKTLMALRSQNATAATRCVPRVGLHLSNGVARRSRGKRIKIGRKDEGEETIEKRNEKNVSIVACEHDVSIVAACRTCTHTHTHAHAVVVAAAAVTLWSGTTATKAAAVAKGHRHHHRRRWTLTVPYKFCTTAVSVQRDTGAATTLFRVRVCVRAALCVFSFSFFFLRSVFFVSRHAYTRIRRRRTFGRNPSAAIAFAPPWENRIELISIYIIRVHVRS